MSVARTEIAGEAGGAAIDTEEKASASTTNTIFIRLPSQMLLCEQPSEVRERGISEDARLRGRIGCQGGRQKPCQVAMSDMEVIRRSKAMPRSPRRARRSHPCAVAISWQIDRPKPAPRSRRSAPLQKRVNIFGRSSAETPGP